MAPKSQKAETWTDLVILKFIHLLIFFLLVFLLLFLLLIPAVRRWAIRWRGWILSTEKRVNRIIEIKTLKNADNILNGWKAKRPLGPSNLHFLVYLFLLLFVCFLLFLLVFFLFLLFLLTVGGGAIRRGGWILSTGLAETMREQNNKKETFLFDNISIKFWLPSKKKKEEIKTRLNKTYNKTVSEMTERLKTAVCSLKPLNITGSPEGCIYLFLLLVFLFLLVFLLFLLQS